MTLSNIDPEHLNQLIRIPNLEELQQHKIVQAVQRNSNNYGKVKVLLNQIQIIQEEIKNLCFESLDSDYLEEVDCNFKKIQK